MARAGINLTRMKDTGSAGYCERVNVRRSGVNVPIGTVCGRPGRWEYGYVGGTGSGAAVLGPTESKRIAIRRVVKGYARWLGVPTRQAIRGDY